MATADLLKTFDLTPIDARMILVGAVVFFVFWRLFDKVIFTPFLSLYNEREAMTEGAKGSSKDLLDKAAQIDREVEEAMHQARVAAVAAKLEVINAAKREAATIAENADAEVQDAVKDARAKREQTFSQARERVMGDAQALADQVVARLTAN